MILALSPHTDDIELYLSFTVQREKPYVIIVTDSYIQPARGEIGCSADARWEETVQASEILKYPVLRLGLHDDTVTEEEMENALQKYTEIEWDKVYAPALQHGNVHHDMVYRVAHKLFPGKVIEYTTYTKNVLWTVGNQEIVPTEEEIKLKNEALMCHKSQIGINRVHFDAVFGRSEWLNNPNLPLYQEVKDDKVSPL